MTAFDVIIIGSGPNGMLAGAYLTKAGLKTLVLERRLECGGGLATEEVTIPGFLHNTHADLRRFLKLMFIPSIVLTIVGLLFQRVNTKPVPKF